MICRKISQWIILIILFVPQTLTAHDWETNPNVTLPPGMTPCPIKDPNHNKCLAEMLQTLFPNIKNGYGPLDIAPIDPLNVKTLNKFSIRQGPLQVDGQPTKAIVRGVSQIKINGVRSQLKNDKLRIEIDILLPKLKIRSDFKAKVSFNAFTSDSNGSVNITTTNVSSTIRASGKMEMKNGQKYMILKRLVANPKIGGFRLKGKGFMPDPVLDRVVVEVINQAWDLIALDLLKPLWEPVLEDIFTSLLSRVPFNRIAPSN